jgi:hypothetical protein
MFVVAPLFYAGVTLSECYRSPVGVFYLQARTLRFWVILQPPQVSVEVLAAILANSHYHVSTRRVNDVGGIHRQML